MSNDCRVWSAYFPAGSDSRWCLRPPGVQLLSGLACTRQSRPHRSGRLVSTIPPPLAIFIRRWCPAEASPTVEKRPKTLNRGALSIGGLKDTQSVQNRGMDGSSHHPPRPLSPFSTGWAITTVTLGPIGINTCPNLDDVCRGSPGIAVVEHYLNLAGIRKCHCSSRLGDSTTSSPTSGGTRKAPPRRARFMKRESSTHSWVSLAGREARWAPPGRGVTRGGAVSSLGNPAAPSGPTP